MFDEISIRKRVKWIAVEAAGYVDIGTILNFDILIVATKELVCTLEGSNWIYSYRWVIGYRKRKSCFKM